MKRLSVFDSVLTLILIIIFIIFTLDILQAFNAISCVEKVYDGCYPWGAEGPAADSWFYKTKNRYLLQSLIWNLFLFIVMIAFLRLPKNKKKTLGLVGVFITFSAIWWSLDKTLLTFF
jgi:hypothetical protein